MGIYVYNSPLVLPREGGSIGITLSIDGNALRGGKSVVQWSNVRSTGSWLTFTYEEGDADTDTSWYYYFSATATQTNNVNQRYALCYADYVLEDGTTGTASVTVYQEGDGGITTSANNPIIFEGDISHITLSPDIIYRNGTKDNINIPTVYGDFTCYATYGYANGSSYIIEYDIDATKYNVTAYDKTGSITFSYANPNSSVENRYELHIRHKACANPFGIAPQGYEIVEEKYFANVTRRIRNIPFKANSFYFTCNFPYMKGSSNVWINDESFATLSLRGGGMIDESGSTESYEIRFDENFDASVRSLKLNVEYETLDGMTHTDYVQIIQNASDGSNVNNLQIITSVETLKFEYNGNPTLYDSFDVIWLGDFLTKEVTPYSDWIHIGTPILIEDNGNYNKKYRYPITVDANDSTNPRNAEISIYGLGYQQNNDINKYIIVQQAKYPQKEPIVNPEIPVEGGDYIGQIWKDVVYDFGDVEVVKYGIYTTYFTTIANTVTEVETLVFKGMSCKRPDDSNKIYINKICQNYLDLPLLDLNAIAVGGGYGVFKLKSEDGKTTYKTYRFVNDWSYTNDFKTGLLSHPILNDNSNVVRGQLLPFTVFGAAENVEIPYGIKYYDDITDDYGNNIDDWDNVVMLKNGIETEIFPYSGRTDGVKSYYIGDKTYNVVDDCSVEYVVYYVNPWGGYDWFPIRGKVTEKDTITQYSIRQNYNNNTLEFGKKRYCNEITKKITLNTQWLREDESLRMWYLLQSNVVYLHNINKNEIYPVVITSTETEYKKRTKNSSRISYQIECEFSQSRTRF